MSNTGEDKEWLWKQYIVTANKEWVLARTTSESGGISTGTEYRIKKDTSERCIVGFASGSKKDTMVFISDNGTPTIRVRSAKWKTSTWAYTETGSASDWSGYSILLHSTSSVLNHYTTIGKIIMQNYAFYGPYLVIRTTPENQMEIQDLAEFTIQAYLDRDLPL